MYNRKLRKNKNHRNSIKDSKIGAQQNIGTSIEENINTIHKKTGNSSDIINRTISIGHDAKMNLFIIYVSGLVDHLTINQFLAELMEIDTQEKLHAKDPFTFFSEEVVTIGSVKAVKDWDSLFQSLLSGDTIILAEGKNTALVCSTKGGEKRAVEEPASELSVLTGRIKKQLSPIE